MNLHQLGINRRIFFIFCAFFGGCLLYCNFLSTSNELIPDHFRVINLAGNRSIIKRIVGSFCGKFPEMVDLNVSDTYWQVKNTTNGTIYLYNAYFDNREQVGNVSILRIVAYINVIDPVVKTYCQLWYDGMREPIVSEVHEYQLMWSKYWGENKLGASPYILSCYNPLHNENLVPKFLSLTEERCEHANNVLEVKNKRPPDGRKRMFIVSVKKVEFQNDISLLLIEWFEFLKIFGADRIEVFVVNVHENCLKVLRHYEREGLVAIKFLKYPREFPNRENQSWIQPLQNDLICYQDTFFENMYMYEYLLPIDIDEFIVPINPEDRTWRDLVLRTIENGKDKTPDFDAHPAQNQYFLLKSVHENETIEGIPKEMRFLSNIYKANKLTPDGGNVKTFMRLDRILAVHNHFPFSCIAPEGSRSCRYLDVNPVDGCLFHFRSDCFTDECKESKKNPTKDTTLWKYKDEILKSVSEIKEKLEL